MKFSDFIDELLNEGKSFNDEKFDKFKDNAGWWLIDLYQNTPSDITKMPGFADYRNFVLNNSKYTREELKSFDDLVYTLPDYYGVWLNLMPFGQSNKIMSRTIAMYDLQDKMLGKDSSAARKRGRKPKPQNVEPEVGGDAMAHFDQAIEKKKRGRQPLPPELKKPKKKYNYYVPTGNPMGRPRKVVDEPTSYDDIVKSFKEKGRLAKTIDEPTPEPVRKKMGRPSKEDMANKYEPEMAQSRIKTLEDRIASLEALLKEKGMLQEQRTLLESRLEMMKDYRKFL